MSFDNSSVFTKESLDMYLRELAKELRKINGRIIPAEIILIGGAAILTNYGFRDMTTDIDAILNASSFMKDAINRVGDRFNLPRGWLNQDFKRTSSYTPKLIEVSKFYKSFYGVLEVRTVSAEYLIAMKLCAGRKYKNDFSDIAGILAEHEKACRKIGKREIEKAVEYLYGGWDAISEESKQFIEGIFQDENYDEIYYSIRDEEKRSKELLIDFKEEYPQVLNQSNINDILSKLRERRL